MMIQAVLGNPSHPEYGVATIPFPIPHDQYAHCMELLEALEIGDAVKADCQVQEINSFYSVLKRTEKLTVDVEELNYLAKRLDSFDMGEATQFQAMAHKLELSELKDLINLTFCCQQTTVITDFSDLAAVGRDHYMNLHGGCTTVTELEALDGEETARQLIKSGGGTVTPYGVVYDNGMKLEQVYDGQFFPCYYYEPRATMVAATPKSEPENTEHITWLYLPMAQEEIDRVLQRSGIANSADARLRLEHSQLPDEVNVLLDGQVRGCDFEFRKWRDKGWQLIWHNRKNSFYGSTGAGKMLSRSISMARLCKSIWRMYWTSCVISFQSESMSASAVRSSRKLPHSAQRKKRLELMPLTM